MFSRSPMCCLTSGATSLHLPEAAALGGWKTSLRVAYSEFLAPIALRTWNDFVTKGHL